MLFKEIKKLKENNLIEFKKAKGGLPKSVWESYSAFANTNGGTIILGIEELQNNVVISSKLTEEEVENLQKCFWDNINNSKIVNINILVNKDVYIDEYDNFPILVINIKRANRLQKPIFIFDNLYSGTYRRNHSGDYHCTKPEIDLMISDANTQSNDKTCLEEFTLDDLNLETISSYRQMLKSVNPSHVFLTMPDEQFYLNLSIAKKGEDGLLHPTRAGLLMFGKEYRITDEFCHYFLDYQNYREETEDIRWNDRVYSSNGEWSGNVFDFFFKIHNKLIQDLEVPFELDGIKRIDDTKMHKAIREALCNTLSNADFYGTRGIVIKKYKDKIEFSNPGCMRLSIEEAFADGNTDPRNETILKMFSIIKIGERAGTGIQTILNAINEFGYEQPLFEESFNPDRTKFTIYLKKKKQINNIYKKENNELTFDEKRVLELFNKQVLVKRTDVEDYLQYGKTKSAEILKQLLNRNLIKKEGGGCNIKYYKNE